jgi:hypothetical protein
MGVKQTVKRGSSPPPKPSPVQGEGFEKLGFKKLPKLSNLPAPLPSPNGLTVGEGPMGKWTTEFERGE